MSTKENPDGSIDVRVVLTVRVDPKKWAADVMDEHPDEVTQKDVRRDVKVRLRDAVRDDDNLPLRRVHVEGLYDQ